MASRFQEDDLTKKNTSTVPPESIRLLRKLSQRFRNDDSTYFQWSVFGRETLSVIIISREVYIKPPKEAEASDFWRLLKCVYGLSDASRL